MGRFICKEWEGIEENAYYIIADSFEEAQRQAMDAHALSFYELYPAYFKYLKAEIVDANVESNCGLPYEYQYFRNEDGNMSETRVYVDDSGNLYIYKFKDEKFFRIQVQRVSCKCLRLNINKMKKAMKFTGISNQSAKAQSFMTAKQTLSSTTKVGEFYYNPVEGSASSLSVGIKTVIEEWLKDNQYNAYGLILVYDGLFHRTDQKNLCQAYGEDFEFVLTSKWQSEDAIKLELVVKTFKYTEA